MCVLWLLVSLGASLGLLLSFSFSVYGLCGTCVGLRLERLFSYRFLKNGLFGLGCNFEKKPRAAI